MQTQATHIQGPSITQFNNIAPQPIPRSLFKRDFTLRTTFGADALIPFMIDEILPGDDISLKMHALTRMTTPIKPLFENLYLETFAFFVPNRLVWDNWEKFQGQQTNPGDSVAYTIPKLNPATAPINTTGFPEKSIYDYFGLPINVTNLDNISALWNRAYELIYNEWFRDENLTNSVSILTGDGPDPANAYQLRLRRKRKDYLTSALPWPQKGTAINIPLGTTAPIINRTIVANNGTNFMWAKNANTNAMLPVNSDIVVSGATAGQLFGSIGGVATYIDPNGRLELDPSSYADLSGASSITINALRQAALYQQILELDARGGTRYVESLYTRFGVISPDFRLQRPELIGQGSTRFNIFPVPQTAATAPSETPQGNLAAFGTNYINGDHGCRYSATEHGMLFFLGNVRADLTYSQGVPKMFSRRTRLDFYEPQLNGLGEQAILNKEIFAQGNASDDLAFGYQERFAEYRYYPSGIRAALRPTAALSLDVWHLSEEFGSLPLLNATFVQSNTPMNRVLAVTTEPPFLMDANFSYNHVRPMPIRSNPGITRL